jgi:hypothetical protein
MRSPSMFALTTRPTFSLGGRAFASMGARGDPVSDGEQTATFGFDGETCFVAPAA